MKDIVDVGNIDEIVASKNPYLYIFQNENGEKYVSTACGEGTPIAVIPNIKAEELGEKSFKTEYGLKYAYYAGAMANGISSVDMVVKLGDFGFMGSYGSGGLSLERVEKDIDEIKKRLPDKPFMVNLLSNNVDTEAEMRMVELLLRKEIAVVEASAYIRISEPLVYFRLKGAHRDENGNVAAPHKVIAKLSREEVAIQFLSPPPDTIVESLKNKGLITEAEADCAKFIPMANDITIEADSAGHTDNRPLISILPAFIKLRDDVWKKSGLYTRIGAAGGIATGQSALAAFVMGAAYVVTGSINQSCIESKTSDYVKNLLSKTTMHDTIMCPSADMFEFGARVQVIKNSTMFPLNAQKLYNYYKEFASFKEIPDSQRSFIERKILRDTFENVWKKTEEYFLKKNKKLLLQARANEKIKMALVFRWYLGKSSQWAIDDVVDRRVDMQIWCGQSMGAFNMWVKGTPLEDYRNRSVVSVAEKIMESAAAEQTVRIVSMCI